MAGGWKTGCYIECRHPYPTYFVACKRGFLGFLSSFEHMDYELAFA